LEESICLFPPEIVKSGNGKPCVKLQTHSASEFTTELSYTCHVIVTDFNLCILPNAW